MDAALLETAFSCLCPRCRKGKLYKPGVISLTLHDRCDSCGLDLARNDCGDGAAVFLIFVLGFLLVPLALFVEFRFSPPFWVHPFLWIPLALGMILGTLKPLKAFIIALQFKHRPETWEKP